MMITMTITTMITHIFARSHITIKLCSSEDFVSTVAGEVGENVVTNVAGDGVEVRA